MICYKDKTFCISPNCQDKCGSKLTDEVRKAAQKKKLPISTAYLCGSSTWMNCGVCKSSVPSRESGLCIVCEMNEDEQALADRDMES